MQRFITIMMYVLWISAIVMVLAATFYSFAHIDLNLFAGVLLLFAGINSFFVLGRKS